MGEYDEWFLGTQYRDKENQKSETDIGNKSSEILVLKTRKVGIHHRHLIIKKRIEDLTGGWILGHPSSSCNSLGSDGSHLGIGTTGDWSEYDFVRVVNPNRKYVDNLYGNTFEDTTSTATWDTSNGQIIFGTNEFAQSKIVYTNNETITTATFTPTLITDSSSSYQLYLSADNGTNWESVNSGSLHTFTNTGQYLKWKITGSNLTCSTIEITY